MQTPAARPLAGAGKPPPKGGCASTGAPAQCIFSSSGLASRCIDPVYGLYRAMDPIPRAHGNVKPFTHLRRRKGLRCSPQCCSHFETRSFSRQPFSTAFFLKGGRRKLLLDRDWPFSREEEYCAARAVLSVLCDDVEKMLTEPTQLQSKAKSRIP